MFGCGKALVAFALLVATPVVVFAQAADTSTSPPAQAQPAQPQPAQVQPATPEPSQPLLKPEQLDALVAPIALYPDPLLVNVLAASTYPLEVVQADRWLTAQKTLKGEQLKSEVDKQAWDDSVKALAGTSAILAMMSEKLEWTKNLGDAVLAQQPELMEAIQRLRLKAQANNKLQTTKQQKVSVKQEQSKQVVVIEPAVADEIYVPYYDPAVVYGEWPYADYPPYYFAAPPYIGAGVVAAGIAFGAAIAIGRWGNYWGGGCNWVNHHFSINRTNNIGNNWQHNPAHRQGVKYANANVAQKFGNSNLKAGAAARTDFRGRDGQQGQRAGQDRPGTGDRAGDKGGDRAGAGKDRAGDRPSTADRSKGGGDRPNTADKSKGSKGAKGGGDGGKAAKGGGASAAKTASSAKKGSGGGSAISNVSSGRAAGLESARGQASLGGGGGSLAGGYAGRGGGGGLSGGGGFSGGGGGGGFSGGGGGRGGGGGGGGRRSDLALKHDVVLLGHLDNGLGYYRFSYLGSSRAYVGVMAQEVESVMPEAVTRGGDGYLRVYYEKLGLKFRTYRDWLASGAQIPSRSRI